MDRVQHRLPVLSKYISVFSREPLEMLLEIGIEKLRRDHVHSLLSNSLATREELDPYIQHLSSAYW